MAEEMTKTSVTVVVGLFFLTEISTWVAIIVAKGTAWEPIDTKMETGLGTAVTGLTE